MNAQVGERLGRALGHKDDVAWYAQAHARAREVFQAQFIEPNGKIKGDSQTGYAFALAFHLYKDEPQRLLILRRLESAIRRSHGHLTSGIYGTPVILDQLSRHGLHDLASRIMHLESFPSFGYQVRAGATTMWERWDADAFMGHQYMNDHCHRDFSGFADWVWKHVAGLQMDENAPGFRRILIQPRLSPEVTSVHAEHTSTSGPIGIRYDHTDGRLRFAVKLPPNTRTTLRIPAVSAEVVRESGLPITADYDAIEKVAIINVGSGNYAFESITSA